MIAELAGKRGHKFALERAVFLTVLHRLFVSGSDRAADRWREDYAIAGVEGLDLHHLYRAMAWLGEELPEKEQDGRTPFAPRCLKDVVEERLFAHRRDLLTRLDLVFMDTTSLYFEGAGGQTLGQHGYSKDHRPDLRQMILAVLIDGDGRPVCSEMWPGNTADVTTLIPVIDRLRRRFDIARVCVVADRGMISAETMAELEARRLLYILGVRERSNKLVRELVLDDPAPFVPLLMKKRGKAMLCYKQLWTVEQTFPNSKASVLHPADLPQAGRDHPWSRVLQLPRTGPEEGAGGPHRGARPLRLLAGETLSSTCVGGDRGVAEGHRNPTIAIKV